MNKEASVRSVCNMLRFKLSPSLAEWLPFHRSRGPSVEGVRGGRGGGRVSANLRESLGLGI